MTEDAKCGNCRHFVEGEARNPIVGQPKAGTCKRYPPTPLLLPGNGGVQLVYMYPQVPSSERCGEYETKLDIRGQA